MYHKSDLWAENILFLHLKIKKYKLGHLFYNMQAIYARSFILCMHILTLDFLSRWLNIVAHLSVSYIEAFKDRKLMWFTNLEREPFVDIYIIPFERAVLQITQYF